MKILNKLAKFFFLAFLISFPFGQLVRLPLPFLPVEARVYLSDLFVFLTLFFWSVPFLLKKKKIIWPPLTKPILAFLIAGLISLLVNLSRLTLQESLVASLYLWRWLLYSGLYFFVFNNRQDAFFKKRNFLPVLASLGLIMACFGLVQYLLWPDLTTFEVAHWDPHYFRVVGSFLDPGFTGLLLVLPLVIIVGLFERSQGKEKKLWLVAGMIIYLALALTYSRSSFLAYLVAAGVIGWKKRSAKFFLAALGILLVTILLLPRPGGEGVRLERWASIAARIRSWQHSLVIFSDQPLFGIGFNAYRYAQRDHGFLKLDWQENHAGAGADSSFLLVLATTGLLGFTAFLWLWVRIFKIAKKDSLLITTTASPDEISGRRPLRRQAERVGQSRNEDRPPAEAGGGFILASLSALMVHAFFLNSLFYPWVMAWVWLLLGMGATSKKARS